MSLLAASLSRTGTNPLEVYDHPISLVDSTKPTPRSDSDNEEPSRTPSNDPLQRTFSSKFSKTGVRESIARRKYKKWQQETFPGGDQRPNSQGDFVGDPVPAPSPPVNPRAFMQRSETGQSSIRRWSHSSGAKLPAKQYATSGGPKLDTLHKSEVDILYENQRGWFFFGIPLYSSKSLLNLDPSAWVTRELKDSPVNITNAQLPDPSWEWAWKQWYVDMSYDVDEEGWQYSFSFASRFSWHGTHPWFHSFARRRRWLRKRVKSQHNPQATDEAHMLNSEYFTIHPKATQSRESSLTRKQGALAEYVSPVSAQTDDEEDHEISDIAALMGALKKAPVDREKIEAVKLFVKSGGEEVAYLQEKMAMVSIMKESFGSQLLLEPLNAGHFVLPSPEELKHRILIKVKASEEREDGLALVESATIGRKRASSSPYVRPRILDSPELGSIPQLSSPSSMSPPESIAPLGKRSMTTTSISSATEDSDTQQPSRSSSLKRREKKKPKSRIVKALADLGVYTCGQKMAKF